MSESFWFSWCGYSAEGCCAFQSCGLNSFSSFAEFPTRGKKTLSQLWYILNITKYKGLFGSAENIFWAEKNIHENPKPQRHYFMWCRCCVSVKGFNVVIEMCSLSICPPAKVEGGICDAQNPNEMDHWYKQFVKVNWPNPYLFSSLLIQCHC